MKMRRVAPLLLLALAALVAPTQSARAQAESTPACIRWWGETHASGLGYDHVVVIDNACSKPAACVVSTDVAPEPIQATVDAKHRADLTTFRGSPASVFKPKVACKLQ